MEEKEESFCASCQINFEKSYKDVLLERFPKVNVIRVMQACCPTDFFGGSRPCDTLFSSSLTCKKCWERPYKED